MKNFLKLGVNLMIVCAVAAGALAVTYALTKDAIAAQLIKKRNSASKQAIAADRFPEKPLTEACRKRHPNIKNLFIAYKDNKKVGYVVLATPRGYGGLMTMVVGIDPDGQVTGVAVVAHNETPGLGSRTSDPAFLKQFKSKTRKDKLEVGKDIDALSGATISSKAVTTGTREALHMYDTEVRGKF